MGQRMSSVTLPFLVLLVGSLAYANWQLMSYTVDIATAAKPKSAAPLDTAAAGKSELPKSAQTTADFPETTARPIFFPDRRMPEKPKPKPQVQPPPVVEVKEVLPNLEPLLLVGTKGNGREQQVLVRSAVDAEGIWLSVGDQYRGWVLREASNDNAIVEGRGQRSELRLYSAAVSGRTVRR